MHTLEKIRDMLMEEFNRCSRRDELTSSSLETIDKLTHAVKSIDTILAMESAGYSDDYSYGRTGRYVRHDNSYRRDANSYRGYSREDAKADLMAQLRDMSMTADGEHKMMIDEWIRQVENR